MGLYLAILGEGDEELGGVEVGSYADFAIFRAAVTTYVENGRSGSKCPTLIYHSDCDGEWSPNEAAILREELINISSIFKITPPSIIEFGWKIEVSRSFFINPVNLYESFFDVDGEYLLERLIDMTYISEKRLLPILFQ